MNGKNSALSNGHTNAEEMKEFNPNYGDLTTEREQIKDTPFTILKKITEKNEKRNCLIQIGSSAITRWMSEEEAKRKIQEKSWDILWAMAIQAAINVHDAFQLKDMAKAVIDSKNNVGTDEPNKQ